MKGSATKLPSVDSTLVKAESAVDVIAALIPLEDKLSDLQREKRKIFGHFRSTLSAGGMARAAVALEVQAIKKAFRYIVGDSDSRTRDEAADRRAIEIVDEVHQRLGMKDATRVRAARETKPFNAARGSASATIGNGVQAPLPETEKHSMTLTNELVRKKGGTDHRYGTYRRALVEISARGENGIAVDEVDKEIADVLSPLLAEGRIFKDGDRYFLSSS